MWYNYLHLDKNNHAFKRRENMYCPTDDAIDKYTTLSEAQIKCSQNPLCISIYDYKCNDEGFWTCSGDIKPSVTGTCTWTKEHKCIIQYFTLYNK